MTNLIIRICLPKGMATVGAATLKDDTTFEVVSTIDPWYCSIDQVRLESGSFIRSSSDITVAASIYTMGREADTMIYKQPIIPSAGATPTDITVQRYQRFLIARQRYVVLGTAYRLVMNFWDINSSHGSKSLGNFAVHRESDSEVPKKLADLKEGFEGWKLSLQSGGAIGYQGRVSAVTASKGLFGDNDAPAGRTWMVTGMGANHKSIAGYGSNGKPVKFGSPSIIQWRFGRYMGGYLSTIPKIGLAGGMSGAF
jgi:hypothetical protein